MNVMNVHVMSAIATINVSRHLIVEVRDPRIRILQKCAENMHVQQTMLLELTLI